MMKGMPFTSKSQLRTCYGLKAKAEASGKKASWIAMNGSRKLPMQNVSRTARMTLLHAPVDLLGRTKESLDRSKWVQEAGSTS
jgi:hypothetical protein